MDTRQEIIEYVGDKEKCPQNWLTSEVSASEGRVSQLLSKMEASSDESDSEGLIVREKKGREKWISLTRKGLDEYNSMLKSRVKNGSPTESTPKESGLPFGSDRRGSVEAVDFHKSVIKVPIQNIESLRERLGDDFGDKWNILYLEEKGIKYQENKYNNAVNFFEDGYEVILTQNYAFIRVSDTRCEPDDVYRNLQRLVVKQSDAVSWLDDRLEELDVDENSAEICFGINEGHTALVEESLAKLVTEHEAVDLSEFKIFIDGELRMWIDNSEGEAHLETRTDGMGVEDLHFIFDELYRSFIDEKDGWREVISLAESDSDVSELPSRVDEVEGLGQEVKTEQEKHGRVLKELRNVVKELQGMQEVERDKGDALIELVRSNQNVIQKNQEIIERQEELIEKQGEVIDSLQDEVEDLRDSKSPEQRVRERFDNDPDYSTVHEHSADGNNDLYVWDYSDGWENRSYERVLPEEARML